MNTANPYSLGVLSLSILLLTTALYGWRSAPRVPMNRHFATQTLLVTYWSIGISGLHSGYATELWGRWTFASAALMPPAFLAFAESVPSETFRAPRLARPWLRLLAICFAGVAALTPWIAHSFFVKGAVLVRAPGVLMPAFSLFFMTASAFVLMVLWKRLRGASGVARAQLRLYSIGLLLFCVGGITTNLILPYVFSDSRYSILGPWFSLVFLSFVAHGIIRYRFMNLRLVIHNWLTLAIASAVALAPLVFIIMLVRSSSGSESIARPFLWDFVCLLAGGAAIPIWLVTRRLLYRYVYRGNADFQSLISTATEQLSRTLAPENIAKVILDAIAAAVRPDRVTVYTRVRTDRCTLSINREFVAHADLVDSPAVLPRSIITAISEANVLTSRSQVAIEADNSRVADGTQILSETGWALIMPLTLETEIVGAVAIGEKLSGAPYYREDIALLQILARQAAVALTNAQLFQDVLLANQRVENIVATIQSGIILYEDEKIHILNEAALRLLDLPKVTTPVVLSLDEVPLNLVTTIRESLATGKSTFELTFDTRNGNVPVMCATSILHGSDGGLFGLVIALTDVSLVNALEVERSRAERLNYYENLAATLAHEIANPLVPIKTMTQLLVQRSNDRAFITQSARTLTREVQRIERLVDRLRALSRPTNHEKRPVDLHATVEEAIAMMMPMFSDRAIEVRLSSARDHAIVQGDENDLHELFLNLLMNAAEAAPSESFVEVSIECDAKDVRIAVADQGPGISADLIEKLFEPLVSTKNRGSGLGLAVCQGIARRHGGRIDASNHAQGAIFVVHLPLATLQNSSLPVRIATD